MVRRHFSSLSSSISITDLVSMNSYEVQVDGKARGKGIGNKLMELLENLGKVWKMEKVMLTVFLCS